MKTYPSLNRISAFVASATLLLLSEAVAAPDTPLVDETFTGPNGTVPAGWSIVQSTASINDNTLKVHTGSNPARVMLYAGDDAENPVTFGQNLRFSLDIYADRSGFGSTTWAGFFFGFDDESGNTYGNAYTVSVYAGTSLAIGENSYSHSRHLRRATVKDGALLLETWYTFEVDYLFNESTNTGSITASLYLRSDHSQVASFTYDTEVKGLTGQIGLSAAEPNWQFDNFRVTAIPESGSGALLLTLAGLAAVAGLRRRA